MKITDLTPDPQNANKGTLRGRTLVERSLTDCGAGRSIVVDKNGVILAGNKTAAAAQAAGLDEDVVVVPSDGTKLVVVQRTDLEHTDPKAKELAIADNRTAEVGLEWDTDVFKDLSKDLDLKPFFFDHEIPGQETVQRANDPNAAYLGMPEYVSNKVAARDIVVHFKDADAVAEFAALLEANITDKTKYIWYPAEPNAPLQDFKYE